MKFSDVSEPLSSGNNTREKGANLSGLDSGNLDRNIKINLP